MKRRQRKKAWRSSGGGRACSRPRYVFVHRVGAWAAPESSAAAGQRTAGQLRLLQRSPLAAGAVYLVSDLTPGRRAAGAEADSTLGTGFPPSVGPAGPSVFANNLIDFSNIHPLALALGTSKGRLVGAKAPDL